MFGRMHHASITLSIQTVIIMSTGYQKRDMRIQLLFQQVKVIKIKLVILMCLS